MSQIEGWGSQVGERNLVALIVLRFELMEDVWTDAVIAQQHVTDSANEY
jgi:hypothetical protein